MPLLIELLAWSGAGGYDWVPNDNQRVTTFGGSLPPRGDNTGKLGMHGFNPRRTLFEGLQIQHEGMFLASANDYPDLDDAAAALVAEHDAMIAAIVGDLTTPPDGTSLGQLQVKLAGWDQLYFGPATLSSWSWPLAKDAVRTSPYMLGWTLEQPYLIGDDDPTKFKVV